MLETLDGGKPIKESRDVDVPLAAAHFFYHAGWADKLEYAFPGRRPRPIGVAAQIIPWNFPLLMVAWKIAPALACGNTVVLKPAETTPLTALLFCEIFREIELPAGRREHRHRRRRAPARRSSSTRGVDKIAFTGSTEVGKEIQRRLAGTGKRLTLELGGKARTSSSTMRRSTRRSRGSSTASTSTRATSAAQARASSCRSRSTSRSSPSSSIRLSSLRVGDPLDKNTDVGAINSAAQLERSRSSSNPASTEGAEIYQPPCELPEKGFWFADRSSRTGRRATASRRRRSSARCCPS